MSGLAARALSKAKPSQGDDDRGKGKPGRRSPALTAALKEAWEAVGSKNFDSFAEAFESAVRIQRAESEE